jgi:AraC-like DNA-binding protein
VRIAGGVTAPSIHRHSPAQARADNDDLFLLVNQRGRMLVTQRGVELDVAEGEATLVTCAEPMTLLRPEGGRQLCVRLPYEGLGALAPRLDDAIGRRLSASTDPLGLLTGYLHGLQDVDEMATAAGASRLVVQHVLDLTALVVGASAEAKAMVAGRGVRAARLKALKAYVMQRLADVSIDEAARAHGISVRYVRRLFEDEGRTFSDYVIDQRAAWVHAALLSPITRDQSIAALAFEAGFGDLSHFNRAFRRRYHATPSEVRAAAVQDAGVEEEAARAVVGWRR